MSTTLRSHYSPYQYADSIFTPIVNDHLLEARMEGYELVISEWMSQTDSPLTPLLGPCQELKAEQRKAGLIKILHAASKLSLQLWVQDSEVEVIDNIQDQSGVLRLFNDGIAETHSLMPQPLKELVSGNEEVDLLVWPRLQVTKFNSMNPGARRRISTKASIVIYNPEVCEDNKATFENKNGLPMDTAAIEAQSQKPSSRQDSKDVAAAVIGEGTQPRMSLLGDSVNNSGENLNQQHEALAEMVLPVALKVC